MAWLRDIDRWFADEVFVHQRRHYAYARRLIRDGEEAEDIVQEAYAKLFSVDNYARIANPHAFTMRIIHNIAVERFRRADFVRIEQSASLMAMDPADEEPLPDIVAEDRAELRRVARAIETLPPRCRQALRLRRIEGLPPRKVAEKMGISVSTVEKHLVKGLRLLIDRLAEPDDVENARRASTWNSTRRRGKS